MGAALALDVSAPKRTLFLSGRDLGQLDEIAQKCRKKGAVVHVASVDIRNADTVRIWMDTIHKIKPLDLFIANAGIFDGKSVNGNLETVAEIENIISTNLTGAITSISYVAQQMRLRRSGRIVLISSLAALTPLADAPVYSATKAGLTAYGAALREFLSDFNVEVSIVHPGHIATGQADIQTGALPLLWTPQKASRRIVDQIYAGKSNIFFPMALRYLTLFLKLLPWKLCAWLMRSQRFSVKKISLPKRTNCEVVPHKRNAQNHINNSMNQDNIIALIELGKSLETDQPADALQVFLIVQRFSPKKPEIKLKVDNLRNIVSDERIGEMTSLVPLAKLFEPKQPYYSYLLYRIENMLNPGHSEVTEQILRLEKNFLQHHIIAWRHDGLCQRLIGILLGTFIARACNLNFNFVWPDDEFMRQVFEISYEDGHSVPVDVHKVLSEEFIEDYQLSEDKMKSLEQLFGPGTPYRIRSTVRNFDKINAAQEIVRPAWLAPDRMFADLEPLFETAKYRAFFISDMFTAEITKELKFVDALELPDKRIGIHLRGGDIVYGGARHKHTYARKKSISLAVADTLCKKFTSAGYVVFVFGATVRDLEHLSQRHTNVKSVLDLPLHKTNAYTQMIREIILMADCEQLISADNTGVTQLASLLGPVKLVNASDILPPTDEYNVLIDVIASADFQNYHPLQQAYTHYCAFITAPATIDIDIIYSHICAAHAGDSRNIQYKFLCYMTALSSQKPDSAQEFYDQITNQISAPVEVNFLTKQNIHRFIRLNEPSVQRVLHGANRYKGLSNKQKTLFAELILRVA